MCGRKCRTNLDLKKHFKQLHERERQKKLNRMRSLKGKKRQRFKERFISGNDKYNEAARALTRPKVFYFSLIVIISIRFYMFGKY